MYIPLPVRLTLFYVLILCVALAIFGNIVYTQAAQRAYHDLDITLSTRAASVRLSKDILIAQNGTTNFAPILLNGVDALGTEGVSIEVFQVADNGHAQLVATTSGGQARDFQSRVLDLSPTRIPWDMQALQTVLHAPFAGNGVYSTIPYLGQSVRVYTVINHDFGPGYVIQVARTEQDIIQSLTDLRTLLLNEGIFVIVLALVGGWFISRGILAGVRRIIHTAQSITTSHNFSQRVPDKPLLGRDELVTLAHTFNSMLNSLEEAYQQQQRFVADASHELRAPITSIQCNLDLLAKAPDLPKEEIQAALSDARTESERMGRLVSDLLLLARSDSTQQGTAAILHGYKKVSQSIIDLDSLLLDVFRQYSPPQDGETGETQGPRLILQHITPAQVYGDKDQLQQALVALIDNACKYTPYEGSVSLSLAIEKEQALVKVSDTGIGILPGDLPHIFERFYRADRARSRNRGGSGLGLSIVQSIMQEHHGTIQVESTPGKGSTFTVILSVIKSL